jgi:hypothetical protein
MAQPKEKWRGRGTATIYEDDSIEFRPCAKGEPSQRNVKRSGASKFYQTNGEKESNYVAHLMAPKDSLDPVGDMMKDFKSLTRELQPQLPLEPRTKPLMKKDGLSVYLDKKEHKLKIFCEILLDTEKTAFSPADWAYTMIAQPLNSCFISNKKDIVTAFLQQGKTSTKR